MGTATSKKREKDKQAKLNTSQIKELDQFVVDELLTRKKHLEAIFRLQKNTEISEPSWWGSPQDVTFSCFDLICRVAHTKLFLQIFCAKLLRIFQEMK